jgi:phosphatidylinositol 4-kinase
MARDIRQRALEKIAALSAASSTTSFDRSDLERLCRAAPSHGKVRENGNGDGPGPSAGVGRIPMVREKGYAFVRTDLN